MVFDQTDLDYQASVPTSVGMPRLSLDRYLDQRTIAEECAIAFVRMLVVGYVFAIRSERLICREVQVNLAYRWFCKLGIADAIPDHSAFSCARNKRFREGDVFRRVFERVAEACIAAGLVGGTLKRSKPTQRHRTANAFRR